MVGSKAKALKNKVVDKVSDAITYRARRNADKAKTKADEDVDVIKRNRHDMQNFTGKPYQWRNLRKYETLAKERGFKGNFK